MKAWEYIINTAMLGTDKPMQGNAELPDEVFEITAIIEAIESSDKEAKFLQKATAIYNYRQCGFTPIKQKELLTTTAPEEIKPYCSDDATKILSDIIKEDNNPLLELGLNLCNNSGKILLPDLLPAVLNAALKDKSLRPLVTLCSGNRGLWLSQLNPSWDYFSLPSDEEIWQTGKPDERVNILKKLRHINPDEGREWIQQTWPQETAASKVDLLKTHYINLGTADLDWLEGLLNEKGQKVKGEVLALLKLIPGSSIVNQYQDLLKVSFILKKEKALLGMMTKVSIQQKLPAMVDESIFTSGIEKLAGQKASFTDESFILHQLISAVPPSFWEAHFEAEPAHVFEYFEKYAANHLPALGLAVLRFNQKEWVPYFLDQPDFYPDFLNMMSVGEQEKYLTRFSKKEAQSMIQFALRLNHEWSVEFALMVLTEMANHPYEYNRTFFNKHIHRIPVGAIDKLEKIHPKDANLQYIWEKGINHLIKLLGLKQQTLLAFNK